MGCCGRGRKTVPVNPPSQKGPAPALPSVPPAQPKAPVPPPAPPKTVQVPSKPVEDKKPIQPIKKKAEETKPQQAPSFTAPGDDLQNCRYREFKSKQLIGGREVENYFCQAFLINVRKEHCRVCQKPDK